MSERLNIYLDQMLGLQIAQGLRDEGHNVVRAFEVGQSRSFLKIILINKKLNKLF